jgi:UDP-N-acetyl-D-galactosamine dehydrogenase|tara:strand:- start:1994 stop:3298 length:1305 start_codon:yes stop_codon:yes gene_type:complete
MKYKKPKTLKKETIGIIGLGYVGLPLALEFGKKFKVIGYDSDKSRILGLKKNFDKTFEIRKKEFRRSKKLSFTNNDEDLNNCNIFIIAVPTPINKKKKPDLTHLKKASILVGKKLKKNDLVIFESTIYPGGTEKFCIPLLNKYSNLKVNNDYSVGYSPERISPGDKKRKLTKIIKIVSGSNSKALLKVSKLYKTVIKAGIYRTSSIKTAEASKIVENVQRDINISLMNELSLIFSKLNIDTCDVLKAAKTKWNFVNFKPGLVGGHCISVDPYYLKSTAETKGYHPYLISSGRKINENMGNFIVNKLIKKTKKENKKKNFKVGIMGITFKENCSDTRNSQILKIIKHLKKNKIRTIIADPKVDPDEMNKKYKLKVVRKINKKVNALIIAVAHREFSKLKLNYFKKILKKERLIFDIKSILNKNKFEKQNFKIWRL